jgi:ABC-type transporter lipoprotein component MlaA
MTHIDPLNPPPAARGGGILPLPLVSGTVALCLLAGCGPSAPPPQNQRTQVSRAPLAPDFLEDPAEPLNRGVGAFNAALLIGVMDPSARVYQAIVPSPVRKSIGNFAHNITYPGRLINVTLQGRWQDAGDDSARFLTNTTLGVGGLFDVASKWDMPKPKADFARTFQGWGWKPNTYLMLPLIGPSDDCNLAGTALDSAGNPLTYVGDNERFIPIGVRFNGISEHTGRAVRLIRSEADPYSLSKLAWSYVGRTDAPDWSVEGPKDPSTLQTLYAATVQTKDPNFFRSGRSLTVTVPETGRKIPANVWLRRETAPLVYILPGIGSHRISTGALAMAEALYDAGFSVVSTSSVFHPEFIERTSTAALPAYPPVDTADLIGALSAIDAQLERRHPGRFTKRALVGASMGGFHTLHLAAHESKRGGKSLAIDRYVAINPPVNLLRGAKTLDSFYRAPLAWPEETRQARINNTAHKVGGLATMPPTEITDPPFSAVESQYLIGLTFRLILRDVLFSSQARTNLGVLKAPMSRWNRRQAYDEIMSLHFEDYADRFVFPYYESRGIREKDFLYHGNLRNFGQAMRLQPKARVVTNRNDFLLNADDISWLRGTFGSSRLDLFPNGGHLGNLGEPEVWNAILGHLSDLKSD